MANTGERYRIFFHNGNELGLKTRVSKGEAWIDKTGVNIKEANGNSIRIPSADIQKVEMFRLHGLGRVIRIEHRSGRVFLSVIRLMIGQFALINFFRTGKLQKALSALLV
ncbi:MAG TPA: hypothetical protein VKB94_09180 [Rhizomicrobium sp.]|nr:hypothetical protein [Rhizomicrobium sp.]